jgi:LPS-assembly lipoprotein
MSSAEDGPARANPNRRKVVRGLAVLLAAAPLPMLGACGSGGFQPLYATTPSGVGLQERLSQLEVAPIPGRVGQRIRNDLIFQASGGGDLAPPTHRLEVSINESVLTTLVKIDGDSLGQIYSLQANFKLISLKDKKVVLTGTSHGRAGFERFQSVYSNVRARDDAENRAARTVADDLKTRVAIYLSNAA